jgi:translation elongation factor EF-Ts
MVKKTNKNAVKSTASKNDETVDKKEAPKKQITKETKSVNTKVAKKTKQEKVDKQICEGDVSKPSSLQQCQGEF